MIQDFLIKNAQDFIGKEVGLKGWVYNLRSSGSIVFLQIRDGSGFIQGVILKNKVSEKVFSDAQKLTIESSVMLKGLIKEEKRSQTGYELTLTDLKIIQLVPEEYPIGKKEHGPDFLLSNRHLWLRSKRQWAIQRVRNEIINAIYKHLNREGFIKIDSPILTPNACEGTTALFPVPYLPAWPDDDKDNFLSIINDKKQDKDHPIVYLSQSGQLYLEAAIMAHGKVFDFGPTFRAEKSKTRRHLMEFWMMDAEAAFVEHEENMKIQENLIVAIVNEVLKSCNFELEILGRDISKLKPITDGKFKIISHKEGVNLLNKKGLKISDRDDFGADAETVLSETFDRPVFIEKYPTEIKAFYMKEDPEDSTRVLNNDLLAPEGYGEIIGGSQREDDLKKLMKRIREHNLNVEDFQWYLDLRRYGSVPHSGFGLGLERLVAWICKLDHVRETIPFPRMMERFRP